MGAMYPMFEYENISEIPTGTGGILFMISSLLYVGLVLIFLARPMVVHFNAKPINLILKNVVSVLNIGLIGFVLSALIARFVFSSTSLEGRKMWTKERGPGRIFSGG